MLPHHIDIFFCCRYRINTTMVTWIKTHKLVFLLLLIIIYLFISRQFGASNLSGLGMPARYDNAGSTSLNMASKIGGIGAPGFNPSYQRESPPSPETSDRMVATESSLSLLVKNVTQTQSQIISTARNLGGYMVSSSLSNPKDAPSATVVVRIPSKDMDNALKQFKDLGEKVVSENISGEDVTDQYVDNEARLDTLLRTKTKFDDMLIKAATIQDTLSVQREIINLQSQIDSIKGSQQYLEKTAQMAKLTIYLSTDEIALPYAPSETWRPDVIFKLAVRSLIGTARNIGTLLIWLGVYAIIWIPLLIAFIIYRKRFGRKTA